MSKDTAPSLRAFTAPRFWPTWIGIGVLVAIACLPHRLRLRIGAMLGWTSWLFARERRYISAVNIRLCFPELSDEQQQALVKESFLDYGRGLVETISGWVHPADYFRPMLSCPNLDVLLDARGEGRGLLVLGAHYSTLDLGSNLMSTLCPFAVTYRPNRNPLFDAFMHRGRLSNCVGVFDRYDLRSAFRHLKKGGVLWYAPDQDYGPEHAVFAPFFGQVAATIITPARLAAFNDSPTVVVRQTRLPGKAGYEIAFERLPDTWPSGDDVADAALVNACLERAIRAYPEQYLWVHKRFKTKPGGKPESPYIDIHSPVKKLKESTLQTVLEGSEILATPGDSDETRYHRLASGLFLRFVPGDYHRFMPLGLARRIDHCSRQLRLRGIPTLTVDQWYRLPGRKRCGLVCHLPATRTLAEVLASEEAGSAGQVITALVSLLLRCHEQGVGLGRAVPGWLLMTEEGCALGYPEQVVLHPFSLSHADRAGDLTCLGNWLAETGKKPDLARNLVGDYLTGCEPALAEQVKQWLEAHWLNEHLTQPS